MEKKHTGLDECLRILLSCFKARNSASYSNKKCKMSFPVGAIRLAIFAALLLPPAYCKLLLVELENDIGGGGHVATHGVSHGSRRTMKGGCAIGYKVGLGIGGNHRTGGAPVKFMSEKMSISPQKAIFFHQ